MKERDSLGRTTDDLMPMGTMYSTRYQMGMCDDRGGMWANTDGFIQWSVMTVKEFVKCAQDVQFDSPDHRWNWAESIVCDDSWIEHRKVLEIPLDGTKHVWNRRVKKGQEPPLESADEFYVRGNGNTWRAKAPNPLTKPHK